MILRIAPNVASAALVAASLMSSLAFAGPYDAADALFAQRESGSAKVAEARAAYKTAMTGQTGAQLAYGVQQVGRLAIYEGQYLLGPDTANTARKAEIFNECRQAVARLQSDASLITHYTYWRLSCTGQWLKFASVVDRLAALPEIKRYFDELVGPDLEIKAELGVDTRYQGGGVERALAGVYSNSLSALIRDGLPNGGKALVMIERALNANPFPGDAVSGADFYRNHRQKGEILLFLDRDADATAWLGTAVDEIDEREADGDLPVGVEPETRGERTLMQGLGG